MWEKEKLLATSNFFLSHSVFKRLVLQTRKYQGLFGKGLKNIKGMEKIQLVGIVGQNTQVSEFRAIMALLSAFPTMFSRALSFRVVKSRDCVVNVIIYIFIFSEKRFRTNSSNLHQNGKL